MKLIVGLGNPGERYESTRHNVGFMVVERFLKDYEPVSKTVWDNSVKFKSDIASLEWQPTRGRLVKLILAKPKTYMNNSGLAVSLISQYLNIPVSDIWIVHDDIDLPLGSMKIRFGGGTAGHHGVESILKSLGTDKFWRFRMGIGTKSQKSTLRPPFGFAQGGRSGRAVKSQKLRNVERFVLSSFEEGEWGSVRKLVKRGSQAIEMALEKGLPLAMNRFNTK